MTDLLGWILDVLPQPRHSQINLVPQLFLHCIFLGGFQSFLQFLKLRHQFLLLRNPKIVDDLLFLRRRTDDPYGAGLQVNLDMIGMRQGRRGIGNAVPFAALEFVFPRLLYCQIELVTDRMVQ